MRMGRLSISRGMPSDTEAGAPSLALVPPAAEPPQAPVRDLELVNERLTALERLVRLYEQGALTPEEFAAEKMLILGDLPRAAPVHFVPAAPRRRQGRSLLGRILGWRFLLLCLVSGIALSFAAQPEATSRFAAQLWRVIAG